ncbi:MULTISPECIES: Hcp family type VI secretion system effector [Photorhabdus]|uniref:Uncharacterized protein n=2 Tax=Photorhabdus asymbiotica TaxID=291112 RepID=B6VMT5_PHOAA|nr:Hcp family type VI secretion system effector [Photorhabdus asymbiotica]RKS57672.1 hypothetical protein BDD30_2481 [Photorhabdus asymbiotica]CAQ83014.1 conserved hypothetical protein [Photorhabdus asymbiotica]CAR67465.1 Hypothetical Protein PA-RVA14-1089 [Photorhabdus asymbiotica subsp. asymbiotica ATCC 43949]
MANSIYVTIRGKKQGLISAGCSSYDSIGNKYQIGHEDQIFVLSFEHDITREQNVNHQPVRFVKPIDKSSPLLGIAISDNEELELLFEFYRTSSIGAQEKYYSVMITKATIKSFSVLYPHSVTHADNQPEEMLSISYQNITWKHYIAGTSGYSICEDRVY